MNVSRYNKTVKADRCYFCPNKTNLETHHIVPQRKNGSDKRENLVIVCNKCHQKLEALYDKRFFERLGLTDNKGKNRAHFACTMPDCTETAVCETRKEAQHWWCEEHGLQVLSSGADLVQVLDTVDGDELEEQAHQMMLDDIGFRCI